MSSVYNNSSPLKGQGRLELPKRNSQTEHHPGNGKLRREQDSRPVFLKQFPSCFAPALDQLKQTFSY